MQAIDWSALSRLVPELAIVIVFIWFILERDKRQAVEEEKRDERQNAFLKEQREANNAALGRMAEEIKANTASLAQMNGVLIAHDNRSLQAIHFSQAPPRPAAE